MHAGEKETRVHADAQTQHTIHRYNTHIPAKTNEVQAYADPGEKKLGCTLLQPGCIADRDEDEIQRTKQGRLLIHVRENSGVCGDPDKPTVV